MALVDPHPALKVSVPMNPMVDGWMGDDWFHYGAFRQINVSWIYNQVATRKSETRSGGRATTTITTCSCRRARPASWVAAAASTSWASGRSSSSIPAYDAFWRDQAVDKLLAEQPLKMPVMLVHSLWDQEDIYGAPAVYKAIEPKDTANDKVFLVIGPWHHGQMIGNGSSLGAVKFGSDTALYFRQKILAPVPRPVPEGRRPEGRHRPGHRVRDGHERLAPATPPGRRKRRGDKAVQTTPLYLRAGLKLSLEAPAAGDAAFEEYVSDPAKPVPFSRAPHSADGLRARATPGRNGSSTTSARPPGARTSWRSSPTR